jgi:hypothetical protein
MPDSCKVSWETRCSKDTKAEARLTVMRRCPVLGTLWIWSIVQLDLVYALGSLLAVGLYTWWNGLKLVFG